MDITVVGSNEIANSYNDLKKLLDTATYLAPVAQVAWKTTVKTLKRGKKNLTERQLKQGRKATFVMFEYLRESPLFDEDKFEILQSIMEKIVTMDIQEENSDPITYMEIIQDLSRIEIIVLFTSYHLHMTEGSNIGTMSDFLIASNIKHSETVKKASSSLLEQSLLAQHHNTPCANYNRLTSLGYDLCNFIGNYNGESKKNIIKKILNK